MIAKHEQTHKSDDIPIKIITEKIKVLDENMTKVCWR